MIDPAILDALVAAGASAEMITAAVKADHAKEQARILARRMRDAERKRAQRDRETGHGGDLGAGGAGIKSEAGEVPFR